MNDEHLYLRAVQEFDSGHRREGLWAKAQCKAEFDETVTRTVYMKLLVAALKQEEFNATMDAVLPRIAAGVVATVVWAVRAAVLISIVVFAAVIYFAPKNWSF